MEEELLKIATYWWGGRRHVGRLSADGRDVRSLALGERGHRVKVEIDGIGALEDPVQ